MTKHRLEFEQDFLANLHDAYKPCCSCGWEGEYMNSADDARVAWENHLDRYRDRAAEEWLTAQHGPEWYIGEATAADWDAAYQAVSADA